MTGTSTTTDASKGPELPDKGPVKNRISHVILYKFDDAKTSDSTTFKYAGTGFLDPLLNCSYSYWKPGQYVGFSGYEGVVQGNIHFAGEHCSQDFQGYMEGGAQEGARAAGEILALLK